MTKVTTMPIELFLAGSVIIFLAKTAVYTFAVCFAIRYAIKQINK